MFYYVAIFFLRIYIYLLYKVEVIGKENIPKEGQVVVCANHISGIDPITVAVTMKRSICFMGKKQLFDNFILGKILYGLNAFPVDRESKGDFQAYKKAISVLKEGKVLGIFFQGTRSKGIEDSSIKQGVAMFALNGNAPIVPVNISGTYKFRKKIKIIYGKPIPIKDYKDKKVKRDVLNQLTNEVSDSIKNLI